MKAIGKKLVERILSPQAEALYVVLLIILGSGSAYFAGDIAQKIEGKAKVRWGQVDIAQAEKEAKKATSLITAQRITALKKAPTRTNASANVAKGKVVASKRGSKYHYPWCSGAKRMSEKNKIWFATIEAARQAGYTPAKNCKGLR